MTTIYRWQQIKPPAEGEAIAFTFSEQFPAESQIPTHDNEGFVICFEGTIRAYRNSCPHMGSPLDWAPGEFFSEKRDQLVCHTHDARFDPLTGAFISGPPCPHGLEKLPVQNIQSTSIEVPAALKAEH